ACSSLFLTWLGEAYARAGRTEEARDTLARAVERARGQGERLYEAYAFAWASSTAASPTSSRSANAWVSTRAWLPVSSACRRPPRRDNGNDDSKRSTSATKGLSVSLA